MKKIARWIAKHRTAAIVLFYVFILIPFVCFLVFTDTHVILTYILSFFVIFFGIILINLSYSFLIKKPLEDLSKFEPLPLYEETKFLLSCKRAPKNIRLIITLNHAVSLREMGDYGRSLELLRSIDIDADPAVATIYKLIYNNNLGDLCELTEQYEEADYRYSRAKTLYSQMKEGKAKASAAYIIDASQIYEWFRSGEYRKITEKTDNNTYTDIRLKVSAAFDSARAHIMLGETECAKEKLAFVIEHAKNTCLAIESRRILAYLDRTE